MITIAQVAHTIHNEQHADSYDAALTLATTYAAQLDYPVAEGGQAPQVEIDDEDAGHILNAARAGSAL